MNINNDWISRAYTQNIQQKLKNNIKRNHRKKSKTDVCVNIIPNTAEDDMIEWKNNSKISQQLRKYFKSIPNYDDRAENQSK